MDIFKQQEISKSRPQVKTKLNKWYDWLINHVPKPIKDGASKAFKTFKDKVMGLYNRVTGSTGNETRIKESKPAGPHQHFADMITDLRQQIKHVCMYVCM